MSAPRGFLAGVVGLSLLQAVASSQFATSRIGGLFTGAATVLEHAASPDVPAIPDLRVSASVGTSSTPSPGPRRGTTPQQPGGSTTAPAVAPFAPARRLPVST